MQVFYPKTLNISFKRCIHKMKWMQKVIEKISLFTRNCYKYCPIQSTKADANREYDNLPSMC